MFVVLFPVCVLFFFSIINLDLVPAFILVFFTLFFIWFNLLIHLLIEASMDTSYMEAHPSQRSTLSLKCAQH